MSLTRPCDIPCLEQPVLAYNHVPTYLLHLGKTLLDNLFLSRQILNDTNLDTLVQACEKSKSY